MLTMVGVGDEVVWIKQRAKSSKTELNVLFRKPQSPDTGSAISHRHGDSLKTTHASGVEILISCATSLPCKWTGHSWMPFSYDATLVAFFKSASCFKKLATESSLDNELSHLLSHCCGNNNGVLAKIVGGYTNNSKDRTVNMPKLFFRLCKAYVLALKWRSIVSHNF